MSSDNSTASMIANAASVGAVAIPFLVSTVSVASVLASAGLLVVAAVALVSELNAERRENDQRDHCIGQ